MATKDDLYRARQKRVEELAELGKRIMLPGELNEAEWGQNKKVLEEYHATHPLLKAAYEEYKRLQKGSFNMGGIDPGDLELFLRDRNLSDPEYLVLHRSARDQFFRDLADYAVEPIEGE